MNKVILMGNLTRDPEIRYSQGENSLAIARFGIAVNRRFARQGDTDTDFFNCTAFGRQAEFVEKYFRKVGLLRAAKAFHRLDVAADREAPYDADRAAGCQRNRCRDGRDRHSPPCQGRGADAFGRRVPTGDYGARHCPQAGPARSR